MSKFNQALENYKKRIQSGTIHHPDTDLAYGGSYYNPEQREPQPLPTDTPSPAEDVKQPDPNEPSATTSEQGSGIAMLNSMAGKLPARESTEMPSIKEFTPNEVDTNELNKLTKSLSTPINFEAEDSALTKAMNEQRTAIATAMGAYKSSKDSVRKRELWESIAHAVGTIAAGVYGLQNNMDLSNLQLNGRDWNQEFALARDDLKQSLENAASDFETKREMNKLKRNKKLLDRQFNTALYDRIRDKVNTETNIHYQEQNLEQRKAKAEIDARITQRGQDITQAISAFKVAASGSKGSKKDIAKLPDQMRKEAETILSSKEDEDVKVARISHMIVTKFQATTGVTIPPQVAKQAARSVFEEKPSSFFDWMNSRNPAEQRDAFGELTNMLMGRVQTILSQQQP